MATKKLDDRTLFEKERAKEKTPVNGYFVLPTFEELQEIEQKAKEDAAKAASSEKKLDFFQTPEVWDSNAGTGEKIANAGKIALGTLGDIGAGAVKGVMKMGEGVGDALQYGAAAVTDLLGADETADRIRRNAQRDAVGGAFSGVDDYLDRYSVLGRTSDAATESLGQIGGVLATGGLAGAAGLGAAGTTAVTTGVMGASSFGSGTGEAYAAGAEEGEAEAYGAIAGAADALSEMIFGGLGKGVKALGLSKGLSSADDMLAKAVSSKIRNTIAKNTVQLGIKAGAEGLEEVLAGTMQAAGKKMTYMSERDFADILADENLLEQFVVGAIASGAAQAPGYVSSNRAGVDLVSDDTTETAAEDAQDAQGLSADTQRYNEETERTGRAAGADKGSVRIAQDVYAAVGIPVSFFREEASGGTVKNGYYHNGTIYVNTASKNPVASIISHELTHSIEQGEAYQRLQNLVLRRMMDEGTDMEAAYREKEMLYTKAGITLRSADDIAHELVAEYVETKLLTDADSITSLVSEDRTLGQRIRAWLDSVLARLGNASAQQRDFVRRARDLYARALGESGTAEQNGQTGGKKYSLTGVNGNGIEIYETSPETVALSWSERKKKYLDIMRDEYRGRTAKFVRNGHVYYAQYDPNSLRKPIYGDNRSSPNGVRALIKAGADGDFFELVENSKYTGSAVNTKDHTKADYFDYFVKTVQIDGKVFDLMADVEKNNNVDGGYVYTLALVDNKKIKASPAHGTPTVPVNNAGNTSVDSISQNGEKVKRKFSVSEVAEETRDLIAVHNLNAEKLIKSLNLGGLPMPSIAIAKAEGGHEAFGDISLVFDKSTIDPERKTTNKVYSGDAWTPTYPRVEYKVNDAVESRVRTKYYDIAKRIGYDEARAMYRYAENLDDSLSRDGGEEAMLARLYDDTGMMQIYLQDTGRGKVEPITREVREEITADQAQQNQFMIDALGEELIAEFAVPDGQKPMTHRRAYMEAHDAEIRDAYRRMFIEREGFTAEDAEAIVSATTTRDLMHIVRDAYQYTKNQGVTIRTETDTTATNDAIRTAAADGYKEWIDGLFSGVQEKTGIRNNQDAFTKTGNRRSWDATHYAETLENVVLAMRESGEKGIGGFGGGNIFGAATQEFSTVADIKRASDRLQNLPQEEIDAIKDEFRERFAALARSLPKNTDSYTATDDAANMLVEAVAKYKTKSGMANYLRRESQGWADYSPAVVDELVSLVNEIRQMPTGYFEAKPQRAVGFDEVAAFVIPRNADIKVKQELLNRGYSIAEYDPDIEGDRAKVLNGMDKYKFSISPSFETEIDAWDRQTEGFAFVVGNTSEALQKAGIPKKQIRMDATKIKKLLDKHSGMTVDIIKQIPRLLEEPVIVIDSKQDSNSKIVMGELYDDNEKPVTAVLLLAPTSRGGNVLDMIKISSAEGRGHIGSLFRKEDGTPVEVRYVDKERIHDWLYVNRLQLPLRNLGLDSDDSISRNDDNVKREFSVSEVDQSDDPLAGVSSAVETEVEEIEIETVHDKLLKKRQNAEVELSQNRSMMNETSARKNELIEKLQAEYDGMRRKDTKAANDLMRRIEREKRLKADIDADYTKRISDNEKRIARLDGELKKDHSRADRLERAYAKIDRQIEKDKTAVKQEFAQRQAEALGNAKTRAEYTKRRALQMYRELNGLKKGVRASAWLSELLDVGKQQGFDWNELKEGLLRASKSGKKTNEGSAAVARQEDEISADLDQRERDLAEEYDERKQILKSQVRNRQAYISNRAFQLYTELKRLQKGTRASEQLSMLLDYTKEQGVTWNELKSALLVTNKWTDEIVNPDSKAEVMARQYLEWEYLERSRELENIDREFRREIESLEQMAEAQRSIVHIDDKHVQRMQAVEDMVRSQLNREYDYQKHRDDPELEKRLADLDTEAERLKQEAKERDQKETRKDLHKNIMDRIKEAFSARGLDFDVTLAKAKDLSTFATVDNTPQRVMEKALGYKEGNVLADLTVNQTAKNETEGIRWLNQYTDRKDGVLAKLSQKYHIKPGSKESAAAQMYAEGFYVDEYNEIIKYGDQELAADFPDAQVRENIKGLAHDPVVRQIYDETLDAINESRTRNAYPEIQKLDNYYLHFRAMDDTFSRLGIPFNPNDIRAKDLPTDLSGVTADLKPGQPYFASAKHRLGKRTSFDLLGGLEQYLTSAKNQIYHIDDIQTLRALRNYIADMYGQANGLEGLDALEEEAVQERIRQVYGSHLSTFAKFLNEEANILAGKTSLGDRFVEGYFGRRAITFLENVNRQVGANMVGFNISSSLTNFLAPVQAFAKMNKAAFVRGFAQTVENRIKSITGNGDDFAQTSDVIVRRKGADRFNRTLWQKMSDPGYLLMGMVDDISTEIIARAKYNELTAKGMDAETANRETDKWVSRLMGDRSIGQMPQIYSSKMLGLITKFQLEVRNQLDSQFYDTIKEAQTQYEEIGDKTKRNAKTAAKVAATLAELAVAQHVFGQVFEEIAGYNPAFDIIEVIATVLGLDDDEESEDTVLDNIEQGVPALIEDLPYSSVFTEGGRIPISSALPIGEFITGEDQYGNEVSRWKTALEAAPYYVLPGGYGQIKKTAKGLSMFMGDKDVTGSYTDSGNLRFPVEATPGNVAQAAVFGQWASENARDYFDNERSPISERQAQGYAESGLDWKDYQKYKAQITKLEKDSEKASAIKELDISTDAKEALYRSLVASAVKDEDGNIIGSSEDERLEALYSVGLDFDDFLDAKIKQSSLNADESLSGNGREARFLAWVSGNGYTDEQADVIGEQFSFASGFRVQPKTYQKMVDGGVEPENAVTVTDALSGAERDIDKINAIWGTGIIGKQLDAAIKAVVSETQYERYRIIIDANVPLEVYTWVLDNADADGNGSISNDERILALSRLALPQSDLSALWLATGGSEKSNPYGGRTNSLGITLPQINLPKIEIPKLDLDIPMFDFEYKLGGNK